MQAGLLTERISIERATIQQNGFGANDTKWTEFITTRAGVEYYLQSQIKVNNH